MKPTMFFSPNSRVTGDDDEVEDHPPSHSGEEKLWRLNIDSFLHSPKMPAS